MALAPSLPALEFNLTQLVLRNPFGVRENDLPSLGVAVIVNESELYEVMLEEPEPVYDYDTAQMIASDGFEIVFVNFLFGTVATVGTLINIYNYS